MNCPFYGRQYFGSRQIPSDPPFLLLAMQDNQCALVTDQYARCWMELNRNPVEWRECPLVKDIRMEHD